MQNVDSQYFDLLNTIINYGVDKDTRSGKVRSIFGHTMRFNLQDGFPLLTTKKVYTKGIIYELLWFLSGNTNIKYLIENNVNIWTDDAYRFYLEKVRKSNELYLEYKDDMSTDEEKVDVHIKNVKIYEDYKDVINTSSHKEVPYKIINEIVPLSKEEFLEKVKKEEYIQIFDRVLEYSLDNYIGETSDEYRHYFLDVYEYGDLGPIYSEQWRNYGVSGFDQIQNIIDTLKTNPDDRRMIINAWNPDVFDKIALPACHSFAQFYSHVLSFGERMDLLHKMDKFGKYDEWKYPSQEKLDELGIPRRGLSCYFYCRSQDVPLGTPFNIASYALLTSMIAQCVNMSPSELIYSGGDCHIYDNQMEGVMEQLSRNATMYNLPTLWLNPEIKEIDQFKFGDIRIDNYKSYDAIKFPLSTGLDKEIIRNES